MKLPLIFAAIIILCSCEKDKGDKLTASMDSLDRSSAQALALPVLFGPVQEIKFYKLFSGYNSSDNFEGSGVYAMGNYYYVVFDNMYKIGKILNTLPNNSSSNSLVGSGSGNSNYEAITYNPMSVTNWYVIVESAQNGSSYYPQVRQFSSSLAFLSSSWTNVAYTASASNKAFEGAAYIYRNGIDYLLTLSESSNSINVMQKIGSTWNRITQFTIPVTFTDYSDLALYGDKIAVLSQENAKLWVGHLSSTNWSIAGASVTYDFPKGDSNGNVGMGNYVLYGNLEGVSFINDSTIVTCTDKKSSSQPSYQSYKDQSLQIWKIR